jgi:phosphoribosylformylglycinamidine cyclo-ligase
MKTGEIEEREMYNVFNMGIGFVMALEDKDVQTVLSLLSEIGEEAYVIGKVTDSGEVDLVW